MSPVNVEIQGAADLGIKRFVFALAISALSGLINEALN